MVELLEIEDKTTDIVNRVKKDKILRKTVVMESENPLAEFFGMWADRDIDGTTLRKQAWGIED
jgi:hypothetical protein